jgi:hypothetical protein
MVFSLEHDIKVTKNHQNLLPTQSVLAAHTVYRGCLNVHEKNMEKNVQTKKLIMFDFALFTVS